MTDRPYWQTLAIKVAAAGPYQVVGRCFYCAADEALASFQPSPFSVRVACCRRCRESRTGVPDTRGLIQGTAKIYSPLELSTPVLVRGLLPATTSPTRPQSFVDWLAGAREKGPTPPEILMHPKDADSAGFDVEYIFAPLSPAERLEIYGEGPGAIDAELLALTNLDAQLDAIVADLDRRAEEAAGIVTTSAATAGDLPPLTLDTIRELQAEMNAKTDGVDRIIVGWPGCPFSEAMKWESRRILLMGQGVLDAIARAAESPYTKVDPKAEWSILGRKVERFGDLDDHRQLLAAFVAELIAGPKK